MTDERNPGLTPEQRAAFRSFVRDHHPDHGGDPEVFVAGLAYFRDLAAGASVPPATSKPDRYDAPIEIVHDLPLPTRVAIALIRTVRHRRRTRVDRPHPRPRRPEPPR